MAQSDMIQVSKERTSRKVGEVKYYENVFDLRGKNKFQYGEA